MIRNDSNYTFEPSYPDTVVSTEDCFNIIVEEASLTFYDLNLIDNVIIISNNFHKLIETDNKKSIILKQMLDLNFIHPDDTMKFINFLNQEVIYTSSDTIIFRRRKHNGNYALICSSRNNIIDERGNLIRVYGTIHNITAEQEFNDKKLMISDALNEIPTLFQFTKSAEEILKRNNDKSYVMIIFDIDKFSFINDLYGYEIGTILLHYIGEKLKSYLSEPNLYCRTNADNFAILLEYNKDIDIALLVINFSEEISNFDIKLNAKLSFGICKTDPSNVNIPALLSRAFYAKSTIKGSRQQLLANYAEVINQREMLLV